MLKVTHRGRGEMKPLKNTHALQWSCGQRTGGTILWNGQLALTTASFLLTAPSIAMGFPAQM